MDSLKRPRAVMPAAAGVVLAAALCLLAWSSSAAGAVNTVPGAPAVSSVTPGNGAVTVKWAAPGSNGGSAVTGYVVTPFVGAVAQPAVVFGSASTTQTVNGLTNGTTYTFTVAATNAVGTGSASVASGPVTAGTPLAPGFQAAVPGNATARVAFTAPGNNGSTITGYRVTPFVGTSALPVQVFNNTATSQTVTGLANGTTYTFAIQAINGFGAGASAVTAPITVGTPASPGFPNPVPLPGGVRISWLAAANNGSPVTAYTVTPYIGSTAQTPVVFNTTATLQTINGLSAGTTYTFRVAATNAVGVGTSSVSAAVTVGAPAPPGFQSAAPGDGAATVQYTVPANNGSTITGYQVTPVIGSTPQPTQTFNKPNAKQLTVTGLTNGTAYSFRVQALNAVGASPNAVTQAVTVGAPTTPPFPSAQPGNGTAKVAFAAPAANGSAVTGYTVTPYLGATALATQTFPATSTTVTVTGLTNASTYTFRTAATNARGTSPTGTTPTAVKIGTPTTPAFPSATAGNGTATITWVASTPNTGTITGYRITPTLGLVAQPAQTFASAATTQTLTGLTNGGIYTFKVEGLNATGASPPSTTAAVTVGAPAAVGGTMSIAGNGQVSLFWGAPADNGSPITGYAITPYIGATAQPVRTLNTPTTTAVITGLTNDTTYTFKIAAINAYGTGPQSAATPPRTPTAAAGTPGAPTGATATAGNHKARVTWTAPTNIGAPPITGYTLTASTNGVYVTSQTFHTAATTQTLTGLQNYATYTITISAQNQNGYGPASTPTATITPRPTYKPQITLPFSARPKPDVLVPALTVGPSGDVYWSNDFSFTGGLSDVRRLTYGAPFADALGPSPVAMSTDPAGNRYSTVSTSGIERAEGGDGATTVIPATGIGIPAGVAGADDGTAYFINATLPSTGPWKADLVVLPAGGGQAILPLAHPLPEPDQDGFGMDVDTAGNLYIGVDHAVLKRTPGGQEFLLGSFPAMVSGVAVDREGNVYAGSNGTVSVIPKATGQTVALPFTGVCCGATRVGVDDAGNVYAGNTNSNEVVELPVDYDRTPETVPVPGLTNPFGVAADDFGNTYVANTLSNQVIKRSLDGTQTVLPITGLLGPTGVAVDANGNVYVTDSGHNRVVELPAGGTETTLPSTGLSTPAGIAVDNTGAVYVADYDNDRVVKLSGGTQTTLPITGLDEAWGVAVNADHDVFVTDISAAGPKLLKLSNTGTQTTLRLLTPGQPYGVSVDGDGNVFVVDTSKRQVVELVKGLVQLPVSTYAPGSKPQAIAVNPHGDVFVADGTTNQITRLPT